MPPFNTLSFILRHPISRQRPASAIWRYMKWQIASRLHDELIVDWVDSARFAAKRGMHGATGNIYCGLHEFVEMAFLLHLLRPEDLFLDIGANVGSYTILASKVCGARAIAFEPDPTTAQSLRHNIALNDVEDRARVEQVALGARDGEIAFTVGLDTVNRVATANDRKSQLVAVKRLDDIPGVSGAIAAKLDVEGFEDEVVRGGRMCCRRPICSLSSANPTVRS